MSPIWTVGKRPVSTFWDIASELQVGREWGRRAKAGDKARPVQPKYFVNELHAIAMTHVQWEGGSHCGDAGPKKFTENTSC